MYKSLNNITQQEIDAFKIVPQYSEKFLELTKQQQTFIVMCTLCENIIDMGSYIDYRKLVQDLYGFDYELQSGKCVCDTCVNDQKEKARKLEELNEEQI